MVRRRGLGKGLGMGYKNLIPIDSHIHSLSAKGVRTQKPVGRIIVKRLTQKQIDDLEISLRLKNLNFLIDYTKLDAKGVKTKTDYSGAVIPKPEAIIPFTSYKKGLKRIPFVC